MSWIAIATLVLTLLGAGSVGVVYAADGAAPGDALYGVDRAVESLQLGLSTSPGTRAQLALAHAAERLVEVQQLTAAGASMDEVGMALDGYGASIDQAARELAMVAAEGDQARTESLAALLAASLSVHEQVLAEIRAGLPGQAQGWIDGAIQASQAGRQAVETLFAGGRPGAGEGPSGGPAQGVPGGPTGEAPAGVPPIVPPGGPPEGTPGSEAPSDAQGFEDRVAAMGNRLDTARSSFAVGDLETARIQLQAIEHEVNALAQELAVVAAEDTARAQALAVLLGEALSLNERVLAQLASQVPSEATVWLEAALAASQAGRQTAQKVLGDGFIPGAPRGMPIGPPGSLGP